MWRNPKHNTKFLVSNSPTAEGDMQLTNVQLTLEQHRFELCGSTYVQIISVVNTVVLRGLLLVEPTDVKLRCGGPIVG